MGSVGRFWILPDAKEGASGEGQAEKGNEENWEWLDRAGVKGVEEEMKKRIVESQREAGAGKDGKRAVGFLPTGYVTSPPCFGSSFTRSLSFLSRPIL